MDYIVSSCERNQKSIRGLNPEKSGKHYTYRIHRNCPISLSFLSGRFFKFFYEYYLLTNESINFSKFSFGKNHFKKVRKEETGTNDRRRRGVGNFIANKEKRKDNNHRNIGFCFVTVFSCSHITETGTRTTEQ